MTARISAILSVYNGSKYVRESIDSLLGQTHAPHEVIVIDDGSSDGSADTAASFGDRVIVLRQENAGQAAAMVAGVARATGEFLAFNDHDDLWPAHRLEHQLAVLALDTALDAVFGMSEQFVSPEIPPEDQPRYTPRERLLVGETAQCLPIRRSAYDRIGGFDPTLAGAFFVEWLGRAKRMGFRSLVLDEVVHRRRLRPGNYGRTSQAERDRFLLAALRRGIRARTKSP